MKLFVLLELVVLTAALFYVAFTHQDQFTRLVCLFDASAAYAGAVFIAKDLFEGSSK